MTRVDKITHQFVTHVPDELEDGVLYVSMEFATAVHRCCCGCGREVVTPLSPRDWELTYNGESISLDPSIGNWSFECQSHYWIDRNRIRWAPQLTRERIRLIRSSDRARKAAHFGEVPGSIEGEHAERSERPSLFQRVIRRLRS